MHFIFKNDGSNGGYVLFEETGHARINEKNNHRFLRYSSYVPFEEDGVAWKE